MTEFNPFATGGEREAIEEGPHAVRCVRVIEIGQQSSERYPDPKNKVIIVFSVPDSMIEINGEMKQRFISNPFGITISNSPKGTMSQYARALCPKGGPQGNLGDFLNQPCQIVVKHVTKKDRVLETIDSIAPILPGTPVPELDTEPFWFRWNKPDPALWVQIPEFTQKLIKEADNYTGSYVEEMVRAIESPDDLPF